MLESACVALMAAPATRRARAEEQEQKEPSIPISDVGRTRAGMLNKEDDKKNKYQVIARHIMSILWVGATYPLRKNTQSGAAAIFVGGDLARACLLPHFQDLQRE